MSLHDHTRDGDLITVDGLTMSDGVRDEFGEDGTLDGELERPRVSSQHHELGEVLGDFELEL
ncbi:MAG: hypothetical protein KC457_29615, partial [Myxococcales bacterium]|nr:hypothetical protein [Myxococcales bacterium]